MMKMKRRRKHAVDACVCAEHRNMPVEQAVRFLASELELLASKASALNASVLTSVQADLPSPYVRHLLDTCLNGRQADLHVEDFDALSEYIRKRREELFGTQATQTLPSPTGTPTRTATEIHALHDYTYYQPVHFHAHLLVFIRCLLSSPNLLH